MTGCVFLVGSRMQPTRRFLGWGAPPGTLISRAVLDPLPDGSFLDLRGLWIVTPTRHAGRRLREQMALDARARDASLLAPEVVTPAALFRPARAPHPVATDLELHAILADVLTRLDPGVLEQLFPAAFRSVGSSWTTAAARLFHTVRATLREDGYDVQGFVAHHEASLEEDQRWRLLGLIEEAFRERLRELGRRDPVEAELASADQPRLEPAPTRLIVAATPDPSVPALRALQALAAQIPVEVWVHAPETVADGFDEWGRPIPEWWSERTLPLPAEAQIRQAESMEGQLDLLVDSLASLPPEFGPRDVAVIVPDADSLEPIQTRLRSENLDVFDPSGDTMSKHAVFQLFHSVVQSVQRDDWAVFRQLAGHPDVLQWLRSSTGLHPVSFCAQLDDPNGRPLTGSLTEWLRRRSDGDTPFQRALTLIREELEAFRSAESLSEAVSRLGGKIYESRHVGRQTPEDDAFRQVVQSLVQAAQAWDQTDVSLPAADAMAVVLNLAGRSTSYTERSDQSISLEGWLEIHWCPAPYLMLTGMNEGMVPDTRLDDPFLPESLRESLGMISDQRRGARDAFLWEAAQRCRMETGRTVLIQGRQGVDGSPVKPSRILLRSPDASEVLRRARLFFKETAYEPDVPMPQHPAIRLNPSRAILSSPPDSDPMKIRLTGLRDYLHCPFHYFLRHVLKMETVQPLQGELGAMDFGRFLHQALERLNHPDLLDVAEADTLADELSRFADQLAREQVGDEWPLSFRIQMDAARQRLRWAADCEAQSRREGWRTLESELTGQLDIAGAVIRGRIDRIDRHQESGALRIVDYKTSATANPPARAHLTGRKSESPEWMATPNDKKIWADLQLPLYGAMALEARGASAPNLKLAYFNVPRDASGTGLVEWADFSPEWLQSATDCATEAVNRIRDWQFWPPSDSNAPRDLQDLFPDSIMEMMDAEVLETWLTEMRSREGKA